MTLDTLPKLMVKNYENYGIQKVAMRKKELGVWNEYNWDEYYENVKYLGLGMLSLGLERGDKVCIIGDNGPQWYWADLAAQSVGGIPVGLFTDCVASEVKYIAENSDSKFAVARDQEQVDKFLELMNMKDLPDIKKVFYWDSSGMWSYDDPILMNYQELQELGRDYEKSHPGIFEKLVKETKADDLAFLAYTSGTTSLPKGALVTHNNLLSYAKAWFNLHPPCDTDDYVSVIAPAWIPEQWYGLAIPLMAGMVVNFGEAAETTQADSREVAPQLAALPPRGWEMTASRIQALIMDAGFFNRLIYRLLLPVGYKIADLRYAKKTPNTFWRLLHSIAHVAVFRPLRDKLGNLKAKVGITSGGFLAPDVFHYLRALGIKVKQAYALTEAGLVSFHRDDDVKYETVGQIMRDVQIRIANDGEIMSKSAMTVVGYWKNPEATAEKLKDGWVRTGDAGYFDDDGHFVILDRVVDLVDLADGGKFSPSYIEGRLRFSPYIREVMAIGGGNRPYVTAIVSIDFETVSRWAENNRIVYTTLVDLSQKPEISDLIKKDIERVNKSMPEVGRIQKFVNLHKEMDADDAELTRTKKLRRSYTEEQYKDMIIAMYTDSPTYNTETEVKYRDGRKATLKTSINITSVQ